MPRIIDPGTLRIGAGRKTAQQEPTDLGDTSSGFTEHVIASGAHAASSITIDGQPPQYNSGNVEGALDELSALVPPRPATVGVYKEGIGSPGIPDWGVLKLNDSPLDERALATDWALDPTEVYGYYYTPPTPRTTATAFSPVGADEVSDPTFNVYHAKAPGGGYGVSHAGAFTRAPGPITQTMRVIPSIGPLGGKAVMVSGVVYPADRGTLAIIHWPAGGDTTAFLAQSLEDRCPAAILLGQGVNSGCDGAAGGIFVLGNDNTSGDYDPFNFPGQAAGQFDLEELHTGVSTTGGTIPPPADGTAGQVRLGVDPNAGEPVTANGILILGGGSLSPGGGSLGGADSSFVNFFRYRLPYLADYSDAFSGLTYTPTAEKPRYYTKPSISWQPSVALTQAGDYTDYPKDYWTFQVARYRHQFYMDDTVLGSSSTPRDDGSFLLLHFRTEAAFEALVRDGVAPADTDLYSANLVDWADPEAPENIADNDPANNFPQASSYHVLRSSIFEDALGVTAPTVTTSQFELKRNGGADDTIVTWVSGIAYFSPVTSVGNSPHLITSLAFTVLDLFAHAYHTKEPGVTTLSEYLGNMNPVVVNFAPFSYEDGTFATGLPNQLEARQRLEFSYNHLGAYTVSSGPLFTDVASVVGGLATISTTGDPDEPAFSTDAKMRLFLRRPLGHENVNTTFLPYPSVAMNEISGDQILYHSTKGATGSYGNIETASGSGVLEAALETALKDTEERLLDETYRYRTDWSSGTVPAADGLRLLGPGLPAGPSAIDLPVRAGAIGAPWDSVSWFVQRDFAAPVFSISGNEAQVAGLPERAPALDYPVLSPFPSRGILLYPKEDYSVGYRPSLAGGDLTGAQQNYSTVTGDVAWNRALDADFSRSGTPIVAEGQPFVTLKIWGLVASDYSYVGPTPGGVGVAILAKVPGITTWMDVGRADGAGPGKQDVLLDGAGCLVSVVDGVDAETKLVYSVATITAAPQNWFKNTLGEVPVLVKVLLKDNATGRSLDFTQVAAEGDPGALRGFIGVEVVRP